MSGERVGEEWRRGIPANINSVVATDGARGAVEGIGGSDEVAGSLDHTLSLPDLKEMH